MKEKMGIRDVTVTGVQTCALPIWAPSPRAAPRTLSPNCRATRRPTRKIGRASCRERVEISVVAVSLKKKYSFNERKNGNTRCDCDWSSDVCSSDLGTIAKSGTKDFVAKLSGDQKADS